MEEKFAILLQMKEGKQLTEKPLERKEVVFGKEFIMFDFLFFG